MGNLSERPLCSVTPFMGNDQFDGVRVGVREELHEPRDSYLDC